MYLVGFARIKTRMDFNTIKGIVKEVGIGRLITLPNHLQEIEDRVKNLLPFDLPLTDRRQVRAAVIALRQVFAFDRLPDAYFTDDSTHFRNILDGLIKQPKKCFQSLSEQNLKKYRNTKRNCESSISSRLFQSHILNYYQKRCHSPQYRRNLLHGLKRSFYFTH